jgi:hypothetical protein
MHVWIGFNSRFNAVMFNLTNGIRSILAGLRQVRPSFHRHLKGPLEEGTTPFGLHRELRGPYRMPRGFFYTKSRAQLHATLTTAVPVPIGRWGWR